MRLVPRFTLRFALLALTIFLIVFGVGVKYWRAYEQHTASVERLLNAGWAVEEEPVTLFGYTIGMKLTGLVAETGVDEETVKAFLEVPTLRDLRGFGCEFFPREPSPANDAFFDKLVQAKALEHLYFCHGAPTDQQLQRLAELSQLRVLELRVPYNVPLNVSFLERLPQLQILDLHGSFALADMLRLNLPRLKAIYLDGDVYEELQLTRAGWGRFPALETLELQDNFTKVTFEPNALPRLRHLDLRSLDKDCPIDWPQLLAALPQLEAISVNATEVNAAMLLELGRCKHLRLLCVCNPFLNADDFTRFLPKTKLNHQGKEIEIPEVLAPQLTPFLAQYPLIDWAGNETVFRAQCYPKEHQPGGWPELRWQSEHWHPRSPKKQWSF